MSAHIGDVLLVLRRGADITQEDLAERAAITQAALSRYENNLRDPEPDVLERLAEQLGVTSAFLTHDYKLRGGIAADAHMRRQKTTKPSDWKRVEARLNAHRMHSSYLLERVPMSAQNHVLQVDPLDRAPQDAAALLRTAWHMPIGPIRSLVQWIESAGVIVVEDDFGTHRIDGMSQWAGEHAVIIVNAGLPTDRKRLTLAHELGHLVLHSTYVDEDMEAQANEFAAEFLMPRHLIVPELRNVTLGKLSDLKLEWGVSMQAIVEHAYRLGKLTREDRTRLYKQMSVRGWRTGEPNSDRLPPEQPDLAASLGERLATAGLSLREIEQLVGVRSTHTSPFITTQPSTEPRRLRAV